MQKTTRRHLLQAAAAGGVTAVGLGTVLGGATQQPGQGDEHAHDNRRLEGKRALSVVAFGEWEVDPDDARGPLDRTIAVVANNRNVHKVLPFESDIDQGGAVSFIISGFHQILIYKDRTLEEVQAGFAATGTTLPPTPPGLVEYTPDRVFRGLSPATTTLDRVESVNFFQPGRYLVVCGVVPHFNEGMHGYVNVKA